MFDRQTPRDPHRVYSVTSRVHSKPLRPTYQLVYNKKETLHCYLWLPEETAKNNYYQFITKSTPHNSIITGYFWFILRFYNNIKKKKNKTEQFYYLTESSEYKKLQCR